MRLLLDTHALLWWLEDSPELSRATYEAIASGENEVLVSVVSPWEMAIKTAKGRLRVPNNLRSSLEKAGLSVLPIALDHALTVRALPLHHEDPFDRMLIAQAIVEGLSIVTRDPHFESYEVRILTA